MARRARVAKAATCATATAAVRRGWPRTLVLNRRRAGARRDRLLEAFPTREGSTGMSPASRRPRQELTTKLRRFCDGTRFRYVFC